MALMISQGVSVDYRSAHFASWSLPRADYSNSSSSAMSAAVVVVALHTLKWSANLNRNTLSPATFPHACDVMCESVVHQAQTVEQSDGVSLPFTASPCLVAEKETSKA